MTDSWCKPIRSKNGFVVSGGAARNVRIATAGGMDTIVEEVAKEAAKAAHNDVEVNQNAIDSKKEVAKPSSLWNTLKCIPLTPVFALHAS